MNSSTRICKRQSIRIITGLFFIWLLINNPGVKAQFNVGLKSGLNLTSINYNPNFNQKNIKKDVKIGYMGGLTFQYFNEKVMGLQFELLFIQKGFRTLYDTLTGIQYERTINYITLPFLTQASFGSEKYQFLLMAGVFGSYAVNSTEVLTNGDIVTKRDYHYSPDIDNKFEFGLQGGAGIKWIFHSSILEVEGNYAFSLSSIFRWDTDYNDPAMNQYFRIPEEAQNLALQITISYFHSF